MVKDGNTTSYTYNINNQLLTEISPDVNITYAYDDNGNLTSKTDAEDANNNATYTWDWRNKPIMVTEADGNTIYEYDGDGTRIAKTQSGVRMKYINDVSAKLVQVLMETDNDGNALAAYNYGNGLISMNRAGSNYYYHYDGLDTVKQITDSSETVAACYTYDGFGNLIASSGSVTNSYGYTGESQFGEADDLVFLRARYYKPSIGRFISRDPIGYRDGMNLYVYVLNNPSNYIDPYGLLKLKPPRSIGCVACMTSIALACGVVCSDGTGWDSPCDTWTDCVNKCMSFVLDPRKSFGPDSNKIIKGIVITCAAACTIGI